MAASLGSDFMTKVNFFTNQRIYGEGISRHRAMCIRSRSDVNMFLVFGVVRFRKAYFSPKYSVFKKISSSCFGFRIPCDFSVSL